MPGSSWAASCRRRACGPSTSIFPTRGGKNGTKSAGCSPTSWWHKSAGRSSREANSRVASDVEEYFALIQSLIAADPRFREQPVPELKDPEHELDYLTNFERKYRLEGRPIFRAQLHVGN